MTFIRSQSRWIEVEAISCRFENTCDFGKRFWMILHMFKDLVRKNKIKRIVWKWDNASFHGLEVFSILAELHITAVHLKSPLFICLDHVSFTASIIEYMGTGL